MIRVDEDALVCDLAESYGIYDWRSLSVKTVATLSFGLRNNSRIKEKLNGRPYIDQNTILLAGLIDRVSYLIAGLSGSKAPPSIVAELLGSEEDKNENGLRSFSSGEEFERARMKIIGG